MNSNFYKSPLAFTFWKNNINLNLSIKMSSSKELKDVLIDTLEEKGIMKDIRAKISAEIFKSL